MVPILIFYQYTLALVISVVTLLISIVLDTLFAPLPRLLQFAVQVPTLILLVNAFREEVLARIGSHGLTKFDVDGAFFFAAPLAAFGAKNLFGDLSRLRILA